jgi:hypothetical protein
VRGRSFAEKLDALDALRDRAWPLRAAVEPVANDVVGDLNRILWNAYRTKRDVIFCAGAIAASLLKNRKPRR